MIVAGPAGAGKTYTLLGELGEFAGMGVIPRLGSDLLDRLASDDRRLFMTMSYYETGGNAGRVRCPLWPEHRAVCSARPPCFLLHKIMWFSIRSPNASWRPWPIIEDYQSHSSSLSSMIVSHGTHLEARMK